MPYLDQLGYALWLNEFFRAYLFYGIIVLCFYRLVKRMVLMIIIENIDVKYPNISREILFFLKTLALCTVVLYN